MLRFLVRYRVMLWPAALVVLALALSWLPATEGRMGPLASGITFSVGLPFVLAAQLVARWIGPGWSGWILPLAFPLGLIPYLMADLLARRMYRRRRS